MISAADNSKRITALGGFGLFGVSTVSVMLVATHKFIVPLDSSTEVLSSALGLSAVLYLASFCALGYALYKLRQKNIQTDPQPLASGEELRSMMLLQENTNTQPSVSQDTKNATLAQNQSRDVQLETIINEISIFPAVLIPIIIGYQKEKEAYKLLVESLRSHKKAINEEKKQTIGRYLDQFEYAFKTLEAFAYDGSALDENKKTDSFSGAHNNRSEEWLIEHTFGARNNRNEEQWIEHILFGKHKWGVLREGRTLLSFIELMVCFREFLPSMKQALEKFTTDTGLGAVESQTTPVFGAN